MVIAVTAPARTSRRGFLGARMVEPFYVAPMVFLSNEFSAVVTGI